MAQSAAQEQAPTLSFEQAMAELEGIVRKLESGQADLASTLADYERGIQLKTLCESHLAEAQLKVESIVKHADGSVGTVPFESEQ